MSGTPSASNCSHGSSNSARAIDIGSSGEGSGSNGISKNSAMRRKAMHPDRIQTPCGPRDPVATLDAMREAESSTVPAAVIHDLSGCGDRKKFSAAYDVCERHLSGVLDDQERLHPDALIVYASRRDRRITFAEAVRGRESTTTTSWTLNNGLRCDRISVCIARRRPASSMAI